ncbi:MAG TPA: non-heme iron oxygenase ferredoxin subunit [Anaerolineales bacterium]|nr:non-heme iron oxygenase ferredoxin subunit [Anaerolineales bacterium]
MFNYLELDEKQCEFFQIAPVEDLPNGERLFIEVDEKKIVLLNLAGNLYALGDVCSHDDGPVGDGEIEGFEIICPRHGARFDIRTGQVLLLPAVVDIPAYPIRVVEGMIEVGIPND